MKVYVRFASPHYSGETWIDEYALGVFVEKHPEMTGDISPVLREDGLQAGVIHEGRVHWSPADWRNDWEDDWEFCDEPNTQLTETEARGKTRLSEVRMALKNGAMIEHSGRWRSRTKRLVTRALRRASRNFIREQL